MDCLNKTNHIVQYGDSLYKISKMYNITIEEILEQNPYLNPYNLQVGSTITICPKESTNYSQSSNQKQNVPNLEANLQSSDTYQTDSIIKRTELNLLTKMNSIWGQHVEWTRMFLISAIESLPDLVQTKERLLENPEDIANIYRKYYEDQSAGMIKDLFTQHLEIGGDIIVNLKNNNDVTVQELTKKWYSNSDTIADFMSSINPFYNKEVVRKMMYSHLDLTIKEASLRMEKDYTQDILSYNAVEENALKIAEYFAIGIIKHHENLF